MTKNQQKRPWILVFIKGSVLGPVLFLLYTTPLTCLIEKHSVHHKLFTDDTQLNHSESCYSDLVHWLQLVQDCAKDIGLWMKENKLQLNNVRQKLFVSHHHPLSARPCHTHRKSLSAIPMLSFLEPSATSASSLIATFQWNNTSSKRVRLHTLKSDA